MKGFPGGFKARDFLREVSQDGYAKSRDVSIAYQAFGEGPVDLA